MPITEWDKAHAELRDRVQADEQFMDLVRSFDGNPNARIPTQRGRRIATMICQRLDLDPAIWRGNVYGAATDYIKERS